VIRRLGPALALGCAAAPPDGPRLLAEVVEAPGATGSGFRDPWRAVNGVRGSGFTAGSLDVFTLDAGGLVLGTGGVPVLDGEGPDLAVFENPFAVDDGGVFLEPIVVEVSPDCVDFAAFPHACDGGDGAARDPGAWHGFAGLGPVHLHAEDRPLPPLSDEAGGDRFDLAELDPADPVVDDLLRNGVLCVRLTPAASWTDEATGAPFATEPLASAPDVDGVWARGREW
jgi:hypothetical protein